ncbi:MAG: PQQ-binding-like beta-propeller repeat protein [Pelagibacterales bacterium]|nr:PQQ-binding-like beta-propeller repeat protein [Pelagibacterales bacterium]
MLKIIRKNKTKLILFSPILIIILLFFLVDNKCLNPLKLIKTYNDFGYSNIKPCYLTNAKTIIRQKTPKLFSFLSDINRHYFSKYDQDILDLTYLEDYESSEKNFFHEVIELKKNGIKGIINEENIKISYIDQEYKKYYKYYSRQNKNHSNTKFYDEINLKKINKINKPTLAWKHVSLDPKKSSKNWKRLVETSPIFLNGKIIYITADFKLIALNAGNGKLLWKKELLHAPSMRGFIVEIDENDDENLYIGVGSNIYKLDAKNGNLKKEFGHKGHVKRAWTAYSPVIFQKNLIVVSPNTVFGFDKYNGERVFKIPIFHKKDFHGALPWGGMALDEKKGLVFLTTGNPRPKTYGVKRQGINHGSNSIIAVDVIKKKIVWSFKETFHDLWNLDIAFPPILASLKIENKYFDVLIVLTKVGNFIMLERTTGKSIFDISFIDAPQSKISSEVTSPYQIQIIKPEPITKFEWTPKDISNLKNNFSQKILNNLENYEFGLFVPPAPNKSYVYMAEGPIWEGGAYNHKNQKLYLTVNQTATITRFHLKSLWPHSKVKKNFNNYYKTYKIKCASCHGVNRNGKYVQGKDPHNKQIETEIIPSLVGYHLFEDLKNKINDFENFKKKHYKNIITLNDYKELNFLFEKWDKDLLKNKKISVQEMSSFFVDENKNFMTNYPQGEIVSYDVSSGKIDWRIPFGYENNKNVGTFNRGGLSLSNDGTLFATGTPDKKIYAFNSKNGEEIWSYKMELSGNAPPIMYEYEGSKYISVIATGGYNFKFPDRGSILYTFKLN